MGILCLRVGWSSWWGLFLNCWWGMSFGLCWFRIEVNLLGLGV